MYIVYILQSQKDGGFYVGCTTNLPQRIQQHNSGKTLSLKNRRPLGVVYKEEFSDPKIAYQREKQIKSYKGGEAFKNLINGGVA